MIKYSNFLVYIIIFVFMFSIVPISVNADSIKININGEDFAQSNEAVVVDGRTYIPLRAYTEFMGYKVSWDAVARETTVTDGDKSIIFIENSRRVSFNGEILYMDSKALVLNGRTYVSIRFIAEIYGNKVIWESETSTIYITEIPSYVVLEGDTLNSISEKCAVTSEDIFTWNNLAGKLLQVGDKLYLEPLEFTAIDDLKTSSVISYNDEELVWLAKIIYTEARDQPYEGLVAVGAVVINRVEDKFFPNTIYDVIFQKGQFTPVTTGKIYSVTPSAEYYRAAEDALLGTDLTNGALFFYNPTISRSTFFRSKVETIQIGNHSFFK